MAEMNQWMACVDQQLPLWLLRCPLGLHRFPQTFISLADTLGLF